ncbi:MULTISPECIES: fluoride efflux transporter CrcB [Streptomyces]|uniref:Fluoride-specific ion channel FluC n=1 Tax=Streptomyces thermoviolaceus subsp. thermoviolaceus TaxID=66860 RepID=A0ABX0YVI0_STRTL|nr:fluoride efflux transporter CrcB [Streptomyces thermoviolaceus]NJP16622.1 fluoride efflux transporter CrcB [Streptomyces thermoviolaceus subsp. thermoviolaceus]WTD46126.1 fluoride efflux transporter CrcB [Streptomyces thermoviolaceus]GGV80992.1 putative fluoride ion transporter CrcB 1 [Streptomyces thermoviolaceus subsp. apingens]GHA74663.1 putative fluoride ion transporter CrcB 1 [Streptomyces thermoviolaceus subsp. thermoviolaceus]
MTAPRSGTTGTSARADALPRTPAGRRPRWDQAPTVVAVALGGAVGASARYGASLLWPTAAGTLPWTTLWVNVVGCAVMGVFMVLITEVRPVHPLLRPFFGTGVLGGFTTFSTYAVDAHTLLDGGRPRTGFAYLALTLCAALAAVWLAATVTRRLVAWRQR